MKAIEANKTNKKSVLDFFPLISEQRSTLVKGQPR